MKKNSAKPIYSNVRCSLQDLIIIKKKCACSNRDSYLTPKKEEVAKEVFLTVPNQLFVRLQLNNTYVTNFVVMVRQKKSDKTTTATCWTKNGKMIDISSLQCVLTRLSNRNEIYFETGIKITLECVFLYDLFSLWFIIYNLIIQSFIFVYLFSFQLLFWYLI